METTFNIQVTMNERWVNDFCSFLKTLERFGRIGHSQIVGFYSDGDGDFRPEFKIDRDFEQTKMHTTRQPRHWEYFDAG